MAIVSSAVSLHLLSAVKLIELVIIQQTELRFAPGSIHTIVHQPFLCFWGGLREMLPVKSHY